MACSWWQAVQRDATSRAVAVARAAHFGADEVVLGRERFGCRLGLRRRGRRVLAARERGGHPEHGQTEHEGLQGARLPQQNLASSGL
jgi:hypothetical protein